MGQAVEEEGTEGSDEAREERRGREGGKEAGLGGREQKDDHCESFAWSAVLERWRSTEGRRVRRICQKMPKRLE